MRDSNWHWPGVHREDRSHQGTHESSSNHRGLLSGGPSQINPWRTGRDFGGRRRPSFHDGKFSSGSVLDLFFRLTFFAFLKSKDSRARQAAGHSTVSNETLINSRKLGPVAACVFEMFLSGCLCVDCLHLGSLRNVLSPPQECSLAHRYLKPALRPNVL